MTRFKLFITDQNDNEMIDMYGSNLERNICINIKKLQRYNLLKTFYHQMMMKTKKYQL